MEWKVSFGRESQGDGYRKEMGHDERIQQRA